MLLDSNVARSSPPGFDVPEVVRLMEHRCREVEQCNMLLLLLLVRRGRCKRKGRGGEGKDGEGVEWEE